MKTRLLAAVFFLFAIGALPYAASATTCSLAAPTTPQITDKPSPSMIWSNFNSLNACIVSSVGSVTAGTSNNLTVTTALGVATVDIVANPTFTGGVNLANAQSLAWTGASNAIIYANATPSIVLGFTGTNSGTLGIYTNGVSNAATALLTSAGLLTTSGGFSTGTSAVNPTSITANGYISAGNNHAATLTAGDLGAARSTTTGAFAIGGSSSAATFDYGVTTASTTTLNQPLTVTAPVKAASVASGTSGYLPPTYTNAGVATASTEHIVNSAVSALGSTTTVSLTAPSVFASAIYYLAIFDETTFASIAPTAKTASSFTFTSVNGHTYSYFAIGL